MIFGYTTLIIAIVLSIVAAYYSILGLTAIFAAAVIPIVIMGAALEAGKVITAVWLHRNWKRSPWTYKAYLLPSLIVLMLLTSMGIFGFLSKAHLDQTVPTGDVAAQVQFIDEKIRIERETIDSARSLLQQFDRTVVDLSNAGDREIKLRDGTTNTQSAAERSLQIRRSQAGDRAVLVKTIEDSQKSIIQLQQEKAPIASKLRIIEAEVGPIKYIAALMYGENPDQNTLERAVRWVIILLVVVFDPLAITLILAGTRHIEWAREEKNNGNTINISDEQFESNEPPKDFGENRDDDPEDNKSDIDQRSQGDDLHIRPVRTASYQLREDDRSSGLDEDRIDEANQKINEIEKEIDYNSIIEDLKSLNETEKVSIPDSPPDASEIVHNYLNLPFKHFKNLPPLVHKPEVEPEVEPIVEPEVEPIVEPEVGAHTLPHYKDLGNEYFDIDGKTVHARVLPDLYPEVFNDVKKIPVSDLFTPKEDIQQEPVAAKATFGTEFPLDPEKGEMFLNVASLPSRLYKFNNFKWIIVDKSIADSYTYNEDYLQYLIDKIELGHLNPEDLTASEQDQITEYLKKNDN